MGCPILVQFGTMNLGSTELDVHNNGCGGQVSSLHTSGDAHLHLSPARLQLPRVPWRLPEMRTNPAVTDLFAFRFEDFAVEGYDPHPHIKAKVAV